VESGPVPGAYDCLTLVTDSPDSLTLVENGTYYESDISEGASGNRSAEPGRPPDLGTFNQWWCQKRGDPGKEAVMETPDNVHEVVRRLNAALGPALVANLADTTDRILPLEWARPEGPEPGLEAQTRLWQALEAWWTVSRSEGDELARQWFIGVNPHLGEDTPVTAIREGRFKEVSAAALAMAEDESSG